MNIITHGEVAELAEGNGPENRRWRESPVGSNPTFSAIYRM